MLTLAGRYPQNLIWSCFLLTLGWVLLAYAHTAEASSSLDKVPVCHTCHDAAFQLSPADPCDACHDKKIPEPTIENLEHEMQAVWQRLRDFQTDVPVSYRDDERYQQVITELAQVSRLETYAFEGETIQRALVHLQHINTLLSLLENEVHSGFWQESHNSNMPSTGWIVKISPTMKFVQAGYLQEEVVLHPPEFHHLLDESLNTQARFMLQMTLKRRGPPSLYFDSGDEKEIVALRVQSLFYFAGCDRSARQFIH